jgi:hypothetical protein
MYYMSSSSATISPEKHQASSKGNVDITIGFFNSLSQISSATE